MRCYHVTRIKVLIQFKYHYYAKFTWLYKCFEATDFKKTAHNALKCWIKMLLQHAGKLSALISVSSVYSVYRPLAVSLGRKITVKFNKKSSWNASEYRDTLFYTIKWNIFTEWKPLFHIHYIVSKYLN